MSNINYTEIIKCLQKSNELDAIGDHKNASKIDCAIMKKVSIDLSNDNFMKVLNNPANFAQLLVGAGISNALAHAIARAKGGILNDIKISILQSLGGFPLREIINIIMPLGTQKDVDKMVSEFGLFGDTGLSSPGGQQETRNIEGVGLTEQDTRNIIEQIRKVVYDALKTHSIVDTF